MPFIYQPDRHRIFQHPTRYSFPDLMPYGSHSSDIYHHWLVVHILEPHWMEYIGYPFVSGFFHAILCLWDLSLLFCVAVVVLFSCVYYSIVWINDFLCSHFIINRQLDCYHLGSVMMPMPFSGHVRFFTWKK